MDKAEILYEDNDIIVIRKPAYFPVESARVDKADCVSELKKYLKGAYLGLIHRLDEPVEGIVVFAKNKRSAALLSSDLQAGRFEKEYLAAVTSDSDISGEKRRLRDYLLKESGRNMSGVSQAGVSGAKEAVLEYEALSSKQIEKGFISILTVRLFTGRHHQIRVQLSHAGMPIIGDRKYGGEDMGVQLCLSSNRLCFDHPRTKKKMDFHIDPGFMGVLKDSAK